MKILAGKEKSTRIGMTRILTDIAGLVLHTQSVGLNF